MPGLRVIKLITDYNPNPDGFSILEISLASMQHSPVFIIQKKLAGFFFNCEYADFWQQHKATHTEKKLFIHEKKTLKLKNGKEEF